MLAVHKIFLTACLMLALSACSQDNESSIELGQTRQSCDSDPNINYICGPLNAEDLLSVGDTGMILTSGMNGTLAGTDINGHIYLINPIDESWTDLVSSQNFSQDFDFGVNFLLFEKKKKKLF